MNWLFELLLGVCLIILCSGIVNYINIRARRSYPKKKRDKEGDEDMVALHGRLDVMEQRLTDVQDVMIILSEKFDRWEEERSRV